MSCHEFWIVIDNRVLLILALWLILMLGFRVWRRWADGRNDIV